jgi:hypothetical protein
MMVAKEKQKLEKPRWVGRVIFCSSGIKNANLQKWVQKNTLTSVVLENGGCKQRIEFVC